MNKSKKKIFIVSILVICLILGIIIFTVLNNKGTEKENNNEDYKIVSKYNPSIKACEDVKIKIDSIVRGKEANDILANYNKQTALPIEINIGEDEELLVVNYEINFDKFNIGKKGVSKDIEAKICQDEEKEYIEYNNKIYMPMVQCINNLEYTKENTTTGRFVTTIPKDVHDYKIKLGVNNEKTVYFDGI